MIENHAEEGYIPTLPVQLGEIYGISKKGRYGDNWDKVHEEYITIWSNRFGRVPQMDRAPDLQPSLGIQRQPLRDLHHALEPEPEPELKLELYSRDSSYHPELGGDDYFVASYPPQYSAPSSQYPPSYSSPPNQVHRWHLRHMIIHLCFTHLNILLKRMLITVIAHNVSVELHKNIPIEPHHQTINF
ncbi:hypothetical protein Gotur_026628, partial [Gossypium turneri]